MKNLIYGMLLFLVLSSSVYAKRFDITGSIGLIRYHEASNHLSSSWKKHVWFSLINGDKSPDCPKSWLSDKGYLIAIPEGNEPALSILLSAKMSDKKVIVTIDDSVKFGSGQYCQLQYITLK